MGFALPVPALLGGALEKIWYHLARELSREHEVTIYSCRDPRLVAREYDGGIRHVRLEGYRRSNVVMWNAVQSCRWAAGVIRHVGEGDIVVTNDLVVPEALSRLRRRSGTVCVQVGRMPKAHHRWLYRKVARFHCPSGAVLAEMARLSPDLVTQSKVIPYPTDVEVFRPRSGEPTQRKRCRILYVGRIHPEKGVGILVEALAHCRMRGKIFLQLVGPTRASTGGEPAFAERLRRRTRRLGLGDEEWALDPPVFDDGSLAQVYREADVFVYPSQAVRGETFGVSVLEAMATGLPCAVSGLRCFKELVCDGENGVVVKENDPRAWANALDRLAGDERLRREAGRRSRERALEFSYKGIAARYADDFRALLA